MTSIKGRLMLFALKKSNEKQKVQIKTTAPGDENYQSVLVSTNWETVPGSLGLPSTGCLAHILPRLCINAYSRIVFDSKIETNLNISNKMK